MINLKECYLCIFMYYKTVLRVTGNNAQENSNNFKILVNVNQHLPHSDDLQASNETEPAV